jgi:hypothetical protein
MDDGASMWQLATAYSLQSTALLPGALPTRGGGVKFANQPPLNQHLISQIALSA